MTTTEVREWRHEKRDWADEAGRGPWDSEPDKIQWIDEATGLDCLMHRGGLGAWCGYVGITEGHAAFAKEYGNVHLDVHGGLTYSDFCQPTTDESHGVCHVPFEGRPHRVWWLGFDCAHLYDLTPGMIKYEERHGFGCNWDRSYRDRAYVENEVRKLAAQLAA